MGLTNNILTPIFRLPIGVPEPRGRLRATAEMCNCLKSTAYLLGISLTTKLLTAISPRFVMQALASDANSKATLNITSVPFPSVPITVFGQELGEVQMVYVAPVTQISMISYNGILSWNMVADPKIMPQPQKLGQFFLEEF